MRSLVFRRKDLCEARPQPEVCSNFQMSFLHLGQMDPPVESFSGQEQ